ncbi:uncharacterized protein BXZ73DRAFT_82909 [Epithele typhae]|uniref:uncharacterized protein n=1 Tax=Epithele typhae TaxID=378194 RepID=UPI002007875E|nr:uncharacterized protein BXZ73DRAFT_82909 [Epithele typhae]KAH9911226.1 hypothetical protein BXZ73DRAFT_82909 [Epithele typhae]
MAPKHSRPSLDYLDLDQQENIGGVFASKRVRVEDWVDGDDEDEDDDDDKDYTPGPAQPPAKPAEPVKPARPARPAKPARPPFKKFLPQHQVNELPSSVIDPAHIVYDEVEVLEWAARGRAKAHEVLDNAPVFQLPKPMRLYPSSTTKKEKLADMDAEWEKIKPKKSVDCTTIIEDSEGQRVLYYLGRRPETDTPGDTPHPIESLYEGRTKRDVDILRNKDVSIQNDALTSVSFTPPMFSLSFLKRIIVTRGIEKTSTLTSFDTNEANGRRRAMRDPEWAISFIAGPSKGILTFDIGVKNDLKTPKNPKSDRLEVTKKFYTLSAPFAAYFGALFEVFYPDLYQRYQKAFDAGNWIPHDPGPWLGRALVWKLPLDLHFDHGDIGPTLTIPLGFFHNGEMEFPALGAVFQYRAGDIILGWDCKFAHKVRDWKIARHALGQDLSPENGPNVCVGPIAWLCEVGGVAAKQKCTLLLLQMPYLLEFLTKSHDC